VNPASRFKQLFSLNAVSRLLKAMLPTGAIICLAVAIGRVEGELKSSKRI
jgi:flagellar biosynthesis protein FlhB